MARDPCHTSSILLRLGIIFLKKELLMRVGLINMIEIGPATSKITAKIIPWPT
jgi:hypothetical protein